jgi:SecD/SecF fusion protein
LQGTANLEFWETYDITEVYPFLEQANTRLREMSEINKVAEEDVSDEDIGAEDETDEELTAEEETDKEVAATEEEVVESEVIQEEDSTDLLDKIADGELEKEIESETPDTTDEEVSLLDELEKDTTKAESEAETYEQYKIQNPLFGILTISSYEGRLAQGTAAVGTALSKDTSKINEYLQRKQIKELFPRELKFLWEVKPITDRDKQPTDFYRLVAIKITNRDGKPALGGDVITNAREQFGQNQATAEVHMTMNGEGAKVWARLTRENKGKQIAVVLDNYVYTFPTVQDEITGGSSQITGNFSISEAKDLANILKSGKLPAPARIIEEEIVGPSLGKEAINSGLISFVIAFILVLIFMAFYYKTAGTVADIALLANIFFIFGVLASLGAVLTLPGIAGMVLTIGMSIDANVLIYERIREEVTAGKGLKLAISDGYKNAYSAIIDSNVTTLLTGIILLIFGHGPIKGFATTLIIGILTSLFSAIFITRLVFIYLLDKKWQIGFSIKMTANVMKNTTIDFLGNRKRFYAISAIIILIGLVSLFTRGLNQGVDFMGGRTYVVRFDKDVSTVDIATNLKDAYGTAPEVKTFGGNNQVKITTKYRIEETDPEVDIDVETKLFEGIKHLFGSDITYNDFVKDHRMSSQKVGPTIADDIKIAAVYSILFALLMMFLYIFMRFRDWRFGLGALAALTHDVLIVLGLFSLLYGVLPFSLEIDQAFIAAILTVVGYSVNDSVVVFDRIREYITLHPKRDKSSVYNLALNSTLSRTIITSFTSFLVLLSIFIFGGAVIRGFIFALLIGIVVGTYSSLFVATPLVFDTVKKIQKQVDKYKDRKAKRKKSK